ncbi:MAG: Rne/Rng family ribonuclease, partial [Blastocatellia bacterium]
RRQRRLRYAEKETKAEQAPAAAEVQEAEAAAEPEEESSGRRRRRPRRRRGAEAVEASGSDEGSSPYVIVHREPLERITDDDTAVAEGEMLKDAMLQARIAERIHEEERRASLLEVEPTPEVLVGSLRRSIASEQGFERISDDSETRPDVELDVELDVEPDVAPGEESSAAPDAEMDIEAGRIEPISEWAPTVYETLVEAPFETPDATESNLSRPDFEPLEIDEDIHEDIRAIRPDATQNGDSTSEPREAEASAPEEDGAEKPDSMLDELKDAVAKIRGRSRRGEMATRRGGRGRRRGTGTYRTRTAAAAEPSLGLEDRRDEEAYEQEEPATLVRPTLARAVDRFARPVITDLLREGQEIIVQIAKEPIGQKGARITSHVALPGRYIVYMPTVEHIGVSRKIGTDDERQRLKRTLHQLRAESGVPGGFIVRTAANGCTIEELREDMQYLIRTWTDIRRRADRVKAPAIAHRDLDLVQRILRDQLSSDFSAIRVDSEFEYERIVDFVNRFAPKLVNRVKLYTKDTPILEHYGAQAEIDKAVKPRVWLKSGGYIVINQTEALVAIDVNTGKFVGKSNRLEDTIVKTNLEAAKEIVRQIRLRDLGGIIVLDFIDMEERKNRQKVMQSLEQELRSDRSPSKILQFNDFGLVAITRKRVKQSLERTLCTPCSYCGGGGMVKSPQTVSYEILAEARRISKDVDHHNEVILRVNPEVAKALRGTERDVLAEIEAYLGGLVTIKSDPTVHQEQFDIALA